MRKAPAPTGLTPKSSPSALTACSGTIAAANIAKVARNGAEGWRSLMTTVRLSGAVTVSMV